MASVSANEPRRMNQKSCDDRDTALPQTRRARELVERRAIPLQEMRADDVVRRGIDEIPVVDVPRHVLQILLVDALLLGSRAALVAVHEDQ